MYLFLKKENHVVKSLSTLMYRDVSTNQWDQINLTKENLDYSIESLSIIDEYIEKVKGTELIKKNLNTFSIRIGAYVGEVIRRKLGKDYNWYDYQTIEHLIPNAQDFYDYIKSQQVLYSKKDKQFIIPMYEVYDCFQGNSQYTNINSYVVEKVNNQSK
ncbi:hypothetical protein [Sporosarcina sp. ZBG7A]|uniref:hypothetical protein n=1 Tax=Sporosarcina sp. ZBG7A TaxID=1582223 RepID=UPI00068C4CCB|nr:hypothetical protein [Sporosarcina sp. ZBG7A]